MSTRPTSASSSWPCYLITCEFSNVLHVLGVAEKRTGSCAPQGGLVFTVLCGGLGAKMPRLRALSNRLKGLPPESEMAWSVVWLHFIAAPFTQGLLTTEETDKRTMTGTVRDLLQQATSHKSFLPYLAANLNNVPGGEHNWSSSVFRDTRHELSHMAILVSFIQDTAAARAWQADF